MGCPVPSFRVRGVQKCVDCGVSTDLSYNYCGKVRCVTCDIERIDRRISRMSLMFLLAVGSFVFMVLTVAILRMSN
jgi:hypothetical protein